jgi:hypothetical protein
MELGGNVIEVQVRKYTIIEKANRTDQIGAERRAGETKRRILRLFASRLSDISTKAGAAHEI